MDQSDDAGVVLRTSAWIFHPLSSEPGALELRAGELAFIAVDGRDVFRAPISEVRASFPRWARNLNFKVRVHGEKFRVCLARPSNAPDASVSLAEDAGVAAGLLLGGFTSAGNAQFETWPEGAKNGRAWKAVLSAELAHG